MKFTKFTHKVLLGFTMLTLVLGLVVMVPSPSYAQDANPTPEEAASVQVDPEAVTGENEYSFTTLGLTEFTLNGPFDAYDLRFGLPPDWQLTQGTTVELDLAFYYTVPESTELVERSEVFGGLLQVSFNGVTATSVLLDEYGDRSVSIPVPLAALETGRDDGRHELALTLISDESCTYGIDVVVVVRPSSRLILPHQSGTLTTDLGLLPRPLYQLDSIAQDAVTFVIPDQPTASEMRAALMVAAGFGNLTGGDMVFSFIPVGQLTPELQNSTHLVFVGKPSSLPILGQVSLPVGVSEFTAPNGAPDDGILQLAISPWNSSKAVFVVGSDQDVGVVKAAQAFSSGIVIGLEQPSVARVAAINPTVTTATTSANRTLADLGYQTESTTYLGVVSREFEFYVPPGMVPEGDSYFELSYAHSSLLDFGSSGVSVQLNGESIGTAPFTEESAQTGKLQARIPKTVLRPGFNRMRVVFSLIPVDVCAEFFANNLWFTIFEDSVLHLPLIPAPETVPSRVLDLGLYRGLFSLSPAEGSVAFVLPEGDTTAAQVASQIAYKMGDDTNWALAEFETYYSTGVPDGAKQLHDLVIVGRASTQPIIAELAPYLPAPFEGGNDMASVQELQVSYRLPASADMGYVELLQSPWNPNRAILAVLGSSDQGVVWSGAALSTPELRGDLAGNFSLVSDQQIVSMDTRLDIASGSPIATVMPQVELDIAIPEASPVMARPGWVLPALGGVVVLMVLVILAAGIASFRKRR